jgi:hypothetical protein
MLDVGTGDISVFERGADFPFWLTGQDSAKCFPGIDWHFDRRRFEPRYWVLMANIESHHGSSP